jgi:hypothetical protein
MTCEDLNKFNYIWLGFRFSFQAKETQIGRLLQIISLTKQSWLF